jgi:hypothetical protein
MPRFFSLRTAFIFQGYRARRISRNEIDREYTMLYRKLIGAITLAALALPIGGGAQAADDAKYPDWKGQWARFAVPIPTQPSRPDEAVGIGTASAAQRYQAIWRRASRIRPRWTGQYHTGRAAGTAHDDGIYR